MERSELPDPDGIVEGGDLDCGSGLLLLIRNAMEPIDGGGVLEVRSREISVKEDLPAWCRMVGHALLGVAPGDGKTLHFAIRKKGAPTKVAAPEADLEDDKQAAKDFAWRVRARWESGMTAKVFARNHSWIVGQPASFDTEDVAAGAIEHLLGALASDLAVGLQWRCSQQQVEVFNLELTLNARADNILVYLGLEDEGSPGLTAIEGRLYVDADADEEALAGLWRETLRRSPLARTLARETPLAIELSKV